MNLTYLLLLCFDFYFQNRKLYRWGFRQVNRGIGPDDPIIFGNTYFQRDDPECMKNMRSVTAASTRKQETQVTYSGVKHPMDGFAAGGPDQKRALLASLMAPSGFFNPGMPSGAVSLTSALRPSMGLGTTGFNGGIPAIMAAKHNFMGQPTQSLAPTMMSSFAPQPQQQGAMAQQQGQGYPNASSTADIVNAAISALRYAS